MQRDPDNDIAFFSKSVLVSYYDMGMNRDVFYSFIRLSTERKKLIIIYNIIIVVACKKLTTPGREGI